ncbi:MAG: YdcF family protein [Kiritimatiellae bacterium]|nr:YdcF family protein [Kiritimatiellia bacterium]
MFALFKWILWLCLPSTIVLVGMALVAGWLMWRKQVKPAILLLLLDALLVITMLPWTAQTLGTSLEKRYPPQALSTIPKADAIVLLGGGLGKVLPGLPYPECYAAADRTVMAFRLWKAGKAPVIVPTGESATEAEKVMLETFGVPSSAILCEQKARDTAENADFTYQLLQARKCRKILLVTSSWHLPRSMMLFQGGDIEVIPVSCDTEATLAKALQPVTPVWQELPSFHAGMQSMVYTKEWLGILFYSFRKPKGKLTPKTPDAKPLPPKQSAEKASAKASSQS